MIHNPTTYHLYYKDLKKYQFCYWFAIPILVFPSKIILNEEPKELGKVLTKEEACSLKHKLFRQMLTNFFTFSSKISTSPFCIIVKQD